jgi:hypothetical protein
MSYVVQALRIVAYGPWLPFTILWLTYLRDIRIPAEYYSLALKVGDTVVVESLAPIV